MSRAASISARERAAAPAASPAASASTRPRCSACISAAVDPARKIYVVGYPTTASSGALNAGLVYSWETDRWSEIELSADILCNLRTTGVTLEGLDAFGNLDNLPASLDSRQWAGGGPAFGAFDTTFRFGTFTGANSAATIDTTETQPIPGRRAIVLGGRPLVDGTNVTPSLSVGWRNRLSDLVTYSTAVPIGATGRASARVSGRYLRARVTIPSGSTWDHAMGVDFADDDVADGGAR
jgi:hypothetical protein